MFTDLEELEWHLEGGATFKIEVDLLEMFLSKDKMEYVLVRFPNRTERRYGTLEQAVCAMLSELGEIEPLAEEEE